MSSPSKPVRKTISFEVTGADQLLWQAIETALAAGPHDSFGELCKAALHQFLLTREPAQAVVLFMELQRQLAELSARMDCWEASAQAMPPANGPSPGLLHVSGEQIEPLSESGAIGVEPPPSDSLASDPLLDRLGPLLEDF